ncbi:pentapeptide repeat-containing protein [Lentzea sp. BCCO 10_0798]|uniref:Pentapeptide repeat-containing protein n=1 Tax=Lentzea kristufekii TaxID=3095430 RepID=A0ABU4TMJ0_9PSEU|nr:pentapeptide repeat-containing protein [Lentzea sp. BCCO 10_0798]MDX8049137.1 pentapeptide repeat-containing protein [Lentzea sp. BCCO 10_0798]
MRKSLLLSTVLASIGVFVLVGGALLLVDPGAPKHEAIKTGGLAGGAIIALYALWLNDRRRKVEEARQELESQRIDHDRSRVADERFARAVELLGHETAQVRVGAMHALAGLAKSRTEYTQTVLDILCAYLRQPYRKTKNDPEEIELEVRLTSQRLIEDLLPRLEEKAPPIYDLNLTKAHLEYMDLSYRQVGDLIMRVAHLNESNAFHHMVVHGDVYLTDAEVTGRLYMHHNDFRRKAWFSRVKARGLAVFTETKFGGETKFADSEWADVKADGCAFAAEAELPEAWRN